MDGAADRVPGADDPAGRAARGADAGHQQPEAGPGSPQPVHRGPGPHRPRQHLRVRGFALTPSDAGDECFWFAVSIMFLEPRQLQESQRGTQPISAASVSMCRHAAAVASASQLDRLSWDRHRLPCHHSVLVGAEPRWRGISAPRWSGCFRVPTPS